MRSEDNLTSPPIESLQDVSGGESPNPRRVTARCDGWGSILQREAGSGPARWEGRCSMLCERTIDSTARCAALQDVHDSSGHRLSRHWDILGHVDGSVTVKRENGCLSTACSSSGKGSLAPTLPIRRVYGTTRCKSLERRSLRQK